MDVIPLDLLGLQKVSPVSKHVTFGQNCKISKQQIYNLFADNIISILLYFKYSACKGICTLINHILY
jgi:hypothetical protein